MPSGSSAERRRELGADAGSGRARDRAGREAEDGGGPGSLLRAPGGWVCSGLGCGVGGTRRARVQRKCCRHPRLTDGTRGVPALKRRLPFCKGVSSLARTHFPGLRERWGGSAPGPGGAGGYFRKPRVRRAPPPPPAGASALHLGCRRLWRDNHVEAKELEPSACPAASLLLEIGCPVRFWVVPRDAGWCQ